MVLGDPENPSSDPERTIGPASPDGLPNAHAANPKSDGNSSQNVAGVEVTLDNAIEIVRKAGVRFFSDQFGHPFAQFPWPIPSTHWEVMSVKSRKFRHYLYALLKKGFQEPVPQALLRDLRNLFEVEAEDAAAVNLETRITSDSTGICIDLGDELWRTIKVTRDAYTVAQEQQIRFRRSKHMLPLVVPSDGGDPWELLSHVSVDEEKDKLLLIAWTVAAFCPDRPVPMLLFTGQQGAAKTTRCRRLRSLLDPSRVPVLGEVDDRGLLQVFYHHAVPCFENVDHFTRKRADMFCRAVTGNGIERRKLYTDMEDDLFGFRRPILMNGIDVPSDRPDFLDRCIILSCKRMTEFKSAVTLDAEFEQARSRLLGSLLTLLVKARNLLDTTPAMSEFRMADFAHFGRAVAIALGRSPEDFDEAYRGNIGQRNRELVEDSPFARAVVAFAKKYIEDDPWKSSAENLLREVTKQAKSVGMPTNGHSWPKSPRWLTSRLKELSSALLAEGVVVEQLPRTNNLRPWKVYSLVE